MTSDMITILIADDHDILRKGLRSLFGVRQGFQVIGEAGDGNEAVEKALSLNPDVILMDLEMPIKGGIEAIREIKRNNPSAHILVLTSFSDDQKLVPALQAGAAGYILKTSSPDDLVEAITTVAAGEPYLTPALMRKVFNNLSSTPASTDEEEEPLTPREQDVLVLVGKGYANRKIAADLHLTEKTVISHMTNILNKLHLENRTQAALYAQKKGLV